MAAQSFSPELVKKIAQLAAIPITEKEEGQLAGAFSETIGVIANLQELDITGVEPTGHTTGQENVFRADEIRPETMFTQQEALQNAKRVHDGYFVVPRIIDHEK